jgi:RNA polymerase sigma-54 factor
VTLLIEDLNPDGYLESSLEEIAAQVPEELDVEPEAVLAALRLLQSFDPVGVGARDLSECLLLQLSDPAAGRRHGRRRPSSGPKSIAREGLPRRRAATSPDSKRMLRCNDEELREVQALIRRLDPRPGSRHGSEEPAYVVPDVVVRNTRGGWVALLNREVMPKLRINEMYAQILKRNRGNAPAMTGQLQEARWLIKNVQQRFDTILRVSPGDRRPAARVLLARCGGDAPRWCCVKIADAASDCTVDDFTVTTQKFMLTPFGTFELKYFFGSHVSTDCGGAASSAAIRELIEQLISAEDPQEPTIRQPPCRTARRAGHHRGATHGRQVPRGTQNPGGGAAQVAVAPDRSPRRPAKQEPATTPVPQPSRAAG